MTVRIPIKHNSTSRAEMDIFRIASCLGSDWDVWMNRDLNFESPRAGAMHNEVDCVLYHRQHGMLVIECKSGRISASYNEERQCVEWFQNDELRSRGPSAQVRPLISPLHEFMKDRLEAPNDRGFYRVRVQWAVCFSEMDTMAGVPTAEIPRTRALLRGDLLDLGRFERRIVEILEMPEAAFDGNPYPNDYLDEQALFELRSFMDGCGGKPGEGELLADQEKSLERATGLQRTMMESIERNLRMRIEGVAGSGKSMMAAWEALRLSRIGKSVAVVCYNDLLAAELSRSVAEAIKKDSSAVVAKYGKDGGVSYGRVDVMQFSEWCKRYAKAAKIAVKKEDESSYYDVALPEAFAKSQSVLRKSKKTREQFFYDAVIIDEGQDFASEWVDGVLGLLKSDERGIVRFFYDPAQRLYGRRNGIENASVESMPVMVLSRSFRSTKRILEWVTKNTGIRLEAYENTRCGKSVKELKYKDAGEQVEMVRRVVGEMMREYSLDRSQVLVVSMHSAKTSALKGIGDELFAWNKVGNKSLVKDKVNIVSAFRIKGLDASVVVLTDVEEPTEMSKREDWKRRLLVGATRAKSMLVVLRKK